MTPLFRLAAKSLWNRRGTATLTAFAIAVSVALLLGVQQVRTEARESFANTISGTDLVVGARSSPLNLLLYAVFRVGDATANVSWETYQKIANHRDVAWTIPLSLGDSHQGFRVLGTSTSYFEHYRYGRRQQLRFTAGKAFADAEGVVIGAAVARELGYRVGDPIVIAHGIGEVSFTQHDHHPLRLVGILAPTGTPVDRTVHVSLDALDEVHRTPAEEAAATAGLGMLTALLTSLNERRREMAILRSVGARPGQIFGLLVSEAAFLALLGAVAGLALQQGLLALLQPWIEAKYGLVLALGSPAALEWAMLGGVVVAGAVIGLVPAWRAYRLSLADGLTVRV